jgi:hypothetical protein
MDKLRVGILGLGRGITHLKNFLELPEAEVVGACDRFPALRERGEQCIAAAGSRAPVVQEFDELLALKPDAIMVASNGKIQVEHTCKALDAGCHVLSEVPGAYTQEECMRLRERVEYTGKTYMLAENTCYWDFFRYFHCRRRVYSLFAGDAFSPRRHAPLTDGRARSWPRGCTTHLARQPTPDPIPDARFGSALGSARRSLHLRFLPQRPLPQY